MPVQSVNVHAASLLREKLAHREPRVDQALTQKIAALPGLNKAQLLVCGGKTLATPRLQT